MKIFKTRSGCTVDLHAKASATYLTKISDCGQRAVRYYVPLTGNTFEYEENRKKYIEFEAEDWDGSLIRISELDIIQ